MLCCLGPRSSHLAIISLDTLLSLLRMCPESRHGERSSVLLSEMSSIAKVGTLLRKRRQFIQVRSPLDPFVLRLFLASSKIIISKCEWN